LFLESSLRGSSCSVVVMSGDEMDRPWIAPSTVFVDVFLDVVADVDATLLLGHIVTRLDARCPDPRLRPFAYWSSTMHQTSDMFTQGLSPVLRVSVHWPKLEVCTDVGAQP
jgi:hypothetical protein